MWRPTSGKPNVAAGAARRTSHSSASPKPPATAGPLTAATMGTGSRARISKSRSLVSTSSSLCARSPPNCVTSMPAQNAEPAPVRTRQRTAGSPLAVSSASASSTRSSIDRALRFSGRSRVTRATPSPGRSTFTGMAGSFDHLVIEVRDVDVTTLEVDAIANAANTHLRHGGGVAGAIARAAGPELERESREKAPIGLGEAVATTAGDPPSRWGIHAATMGLDGRTSADIIRRATAATLWKADELGASSLALVAFGTGVGGFPIDIAADIEVDEARRHLDSGSRIAKIIFAVRGKPALSAFLTVLDH